jgi:hypothetical protein
MKISNGFVSNSSSSSFMIYGVRLGYKDVDKINKTKDIENFLIEKGLPYETIPDCDEYYIGYSRDTIKDDETGKQFKERIEKEIKEALKDFELNLKFNTYSEGWYQG